MSLFAAPAPRSPGDPRPPLPDGLAIRTAGLADVARIGALAHARNGGELAPHLAGVERELERIEAGDERGLWVAALDGEVVAYARAARFVPAPDAPADVAPAGWYLSGLVVAPERRRCGVGEALTIARIDWLAGRTDCVRYFANARNYATIALHTRLGFVETTRRFSFPGVAFEGGEGILFERRAAAR